MARVQNTLIGKSSGSVGGATFSTWKGINVLKSKAISVSNPKTDAQKLQRSRLTIMVALYRICAEIVTLGFKTLAIGKSEYNAFMSDNIQSATAPATADSAEFVPAQLKLSKGTIGTIPILTMVGTDSSADVDFTWNDALTPIGSSPGDTAIFAVYNATKDEWGFDTGLDVRSSGGASTAMPSNVATSDVLHGYMFFESASSEEVSDSVYITQTV